MSLIIRNFKRRRRWQAGSLSAAESYPTSEVRDSGPECQAATVQERLGGANPRPRSGAAAGRRHPEPEARGSDPEEPPRARGQGRQPGEATRGVVDEQAQEGLEELSHIEDQKRRR